MQLRIPLYHGLECAFEDIVYSYLRKVLNDIGYSFKVKRTGFPEIDNLITSRSSGNVGKGVCDGYVFSDSDFKSFVGLVELESTGKIDSGIKQILTYAKGFGSTKLNDEQKQIVSSIKKRDIVLIVYDGQTIYLALYNLNTGKENVILDKINVLSKHQLVTNQIINSFPKKEIINREDDEKGLIETIAKIIRGHEKLQKNKALLMTTLASMYGASEEADFETAKSLLKKSQVSYEKKLYETFEKFLEEVPAANDRNKISVLYEKAALKLYELSQDRGMDLYGFIYEELASKEAKKEQGEYYTPRHTIRPLVRAVFENYLNWEKNELEDKTIFDPFCGSGGFLYEYIQLLKTKFDLDNDTIDDLAKKTLWGVDKNNVLAAYLNLYLIGDGSANIDRVKTSINWRKSFLYKNKDKYETIRVNDKEAKANLKESLQDVRTLMSLYVARDFKVNLGEIEKHLHSTDPLRELIAEKQNWNKSGKDERNLGTVDLLITNVPYGKVTEANEQFVDSGNTPYSSSLEANGLRECIDFLKPAKMKNGKITEEGGIAITVVPDSVLENVSNKPIRDYLIERCNILAIVGLPPYTFAPYAMEKTYALIFQKIAPEEFNYQRNLKEVAPTLMYYSMCDGKANSQNRFRTDQITSTPIKVFESGKNKTIKVAEYLHNDFEPCFESYDIKTPTYRSKLEWAWNQSFVKQNENWDKQRLLETWKGDGWDKMEGEKWGYYQIKRVEREIEKVVKSKSLLDKVTDFMQGKSETEIDKFIGIDNYNSLKKLLIKSVELKPAEKDTLDEIDFLKYDGESFLLIKTDITQDINLNPDTTDYLGLTEKKIAIEDLESALEKLNVRTEEDIIKFFRNQFTSKTLTPVKVLDSFYVEQGTGFSKRDAYKYPGSIPVFTAATDGPAYFVADNIKGKVKLTGPTLIWSRKGAKAGTIQIFDEASDFYISDVSGTIKPKKLDKSIDFIFLKFYLSGQVKKSLQSRDNNAQLNKTKLENLKILLPDNQKKLGDIIRAKLKALTIL
jgi:type I restriction-modification system DNA methylase subunit